MWSWCFFFLQSIHVSTLKVQGNFLVCFFFSSTDSAFPQNLSCLCWTGEVNNHSHLSDWWIYAWFFIMSNLWVTSSLQRQTGIGSNQPILWPLEWTAGYTYCMTGSSKAQPSGQWLWNRMGEVKVRFVGKTGASYRTFTVLSWPLTRECHVSCSSQNFYFILIFFFPTLIWYISKEEEDLMISQQLIGNRKGHRTYEMGWVGEQNH